MAFPGPIEEPNTILEINEAHADNFLLVIPNLPTAQFLGAAFNEFTQPAPTTPGTSSNPDSGDCDAVLQSQIRREQNLDRVNFRLYISDVIVPNVSISKYELGTQFATLSRASKIQFSELVTTMMVSENLLNYNMILFWLYALHNPEQYNQVSGREMIKEYFTDMYLIITNNHREKVAEYKFLDAFPINLPSLPMSYKNPAKLVTDITWAHSGMFITDNFVLRYV